jgi:hypothetical protein
MQNVIVDIQEDVSIWCFNNKHEDFYFFFEFLMFVYSYFPEKDFQLKECYNQKEFYILIETQNIKCD